MANRKKNGSSEVRLGRPQSLVLVATICGSLLLSYYLGFLSGRNKGFEDGRISDLAREPRLQITSGEGANPLDDELIARLYAKLDEDPVINGPGSGVAADEGPDLGSLAARSGMVELDFASKPFSAEISKQDYPEETLGALLIERERQTQLADKLYEQEQAEDSLRELEAEIVDDSVAGLPLKEPVPQEHEFEEVESQENLEAEVPLIEDVVSKDEHQVLVDYLVATVPRGWFAQVAAPGNLDDANELASLLHQSGFPVLIENARVRGENYFRVLVGPEENRQQAERLVSQLKRERFLYDDPFIRLVN